MVFCAEPEDRLRKLFVEEVRDKLMTTAYAATTVKTHNNQLAQYEKFLRKIDECEEAWSELSCVLWVLDTMDQGFKKATLHAKVSAFIWGAALKKGIQFKSSSPADLLYLLKRAIQRRGDDAKPKLAITGDVLVKITAKLRTSLPLRKFLEVVAWFLLSYAGMLRASETAQPRWEHVMFPALPLGRMEVPSHMEIVLKVGSAHVFKNHTNSVTLRFKRAPNPRLCPIVAMWNWWAFTDRTNGSVFCMGVVEARQLLQQGAAKVTDNVALDFGLHSLRSGGATDADKQGSSLGEIKAMGRWRSTTVLDIYEMQMKLRKNWVYLSLAVLVVFLRS